jgi:hypothetical protein
MKARRFTAWAIVLVASLATFTAYLRPDMLVSMADFIWSCF